MAYPGQHRRGHGQGAGAGDRRQGAQAKGRGVGRCAVRSVRGQLRRRYTGLRGSGVGHADAGAMSEDNWTNGGQPYAVLFFLG